MGDIHIVMVLGGILVCEEQETRSVAYVARQSINDEPAPRLRVSYLRGLSQHPSSRIPA